MSSSNTSGHSSDAHPRHRSSSSPTKGNNTNPVILEDEDVDASPVSPTTPAISEKYINTIFEVITALGDKLNNEVTANRNQLNQLSAHLDRLESHWNKQVGTFKADINTIRTHQGHDVRNATYIKDLEEKTLPNLKNRLRKLEDASRDTASKSAAPTVTEEKARSEALTQTEPVPVSNTGGLNYNTVFGKTTGRSFTKTACPQKLSAKELRSRVSISDFRKSWHLAVSAAHRVFALSPAAYNPDQHTPFEYYRILEKENPAARLGKTPEHILSFQFKPADENTVFEHFQQQIRGIVDSRKTSPATEDKSPDDEPGPSEPPAKRQKVSFAFEQRAAALRDKFGI